MGRFYVLIAGASGFLLSASVVNATTITANTLDVRFDRPAQTVHFSMSFDRAPDFLTVDGANRVSDGFALWIDANHDSTYPEQGYAERFITTDSIHASGKLAMLNVISFLGGGANHYGEPGQSTVANPDYSLAYSLVGNAMQFDLPINALGSDDGGYFFFSMLTMQYGGGYPGQHITLARSLPPDAPAIEMYPPLVSVNGNPPGVFPNTDDYLPLQPIDTTPQPTGSTIPEPASLASLAMGALLLLRRRGKLNP